MDGQNGAYCFRYVSIWTARFDAVFGQRLRLSKNATAFFGFKITTSLVLLYPISIYLLIERPSAYTKDLGCPCPVPAGYLQNLLYMFLFHILNGLDPIFHPLPSIHHKIQTEILWRDYPSLFHNDHPFDEVFNLPDVPWPVIPHQGIHAILGDPLDISMVTLIIPFYKVMDKEG